MSNNLSKIPVRFEFSQAYFFKTFGIQAIGRIFSPLKTTNTIAHVCTYTLISVHLAVYFMATELPSKYVNASKHEWFKFVKIKYLIMKRAKVMWGA